MLTNILAYVVPISLVALLVWWHLSKSGKVPSLEVGDGAKKILLFGAGAVVLGILLYCAYSFGLIDLVWSYSAWWPLAILSVLIILFAFEKIRPFATVGIFLTVLIWVVTSIAIWGTDKITGVSSPPTTICASENDKLVLENKPLTVTLCSLKLEDHNIMRIRRIGPRDVKLSFATETLMMHSNQLKGSHAEEFYVLQKANCFGDNFCFYIKPNNEKFYELGLDLVPLKFTVEYTTQDMPTR